MITLDQVGPLLGAIFGAGGVSGITAAVFGYLKAVREGRDPAKAPTFTIAGDHVGAQWDKTVSNHLGTIAYALTRLVAIHEVRAKHDLEDTDFADRLESRIDRLTIEAIKAWNKDPT